MSAREEVISLIDEFLENWKQSNFNYFMGKRDSIRSLRDYSQYFPKGFSSSYLNMKRLINPKTKAGSPDRFQEENVEKLARRENIDVAELKRCLNDYARALSQIQALRDTITDRLVSSSKDEAEEYLNKFLDREVKSRKLTFIESIEGAGGDMVKVISLKIGDDSMLNGVVSCTRHDVKVETVGAGGYNIQRFHYRLLCHALKERINKNIAEDLKTFVPPVRKTKQEVAKLEINDYILKQAERLEAKKNKEGKSRGQDIWDKVTSLGYLKLVEESGYKKYLDTPTYPIFIKDLDEDRYFIWCMAFAYTLNKNEDLPPKQRLKLYWNVEGTDSMERIESMMKRIKLDEFEKLVPLMAKRGTFTRYGEKTAEEIKEEEKQNKINSLQTTEETPDDEIAGDSDFEQNAKKTFRDNVIKLEEDSDFRGVKVWERMQEYNYDKKLMDMGYKVYVQTKLYPYFYKDYPEYRIIIGMTLGYILTDYNKEYPQFHNIYYFFKGGTSKISDFDKLHKSYKAPEFELLGELFNLRKKLTNYEGSNTPALPNSSKGTYSKYKIEEFRLIPVAENLVKDLSDKQKNERLMKVAKRFNENNYGQYYKDNGFEEIFVNIQNKKIPVPVYVKKMKNEVKGNSKTYVMDIILVITMQQMYLIESDGRLVEIGNVSEQGTSLKDILAFGEKYNIKDTVLFAKYNNLRAKLEPYKPKK